MGGILNFPGNYIPKDLGLISEEHRNRLVEELRAKQADCQKQISDPVNHPSHYTRGGKYECIDIVEYLGLGFHLGNAMKYIWRCGHKNDSIEDLKKAVWYIERKIKLIESEGGRV